MQFLHAEAIFKSLGAVTSLWNTLASLDAHIYLGSAPVGGGRAAIEAQGCGYPVAYFQTPDQSSVLAVDSIYASKQLGWANPPALSVMLKTISPQLPYLSDLARSLYERKYSREKFVSVLNEIIE